MTGSILVGLAGDTAGQASFTEVSSSCGIQSSGFTGISWDVAFGDVNGDGIIDLYCMAHDQGRDRKSSKLYFSNSSLHLTDVTGSAFGGITTTGGGQGVLLVDLDGDRDLDLITGSNDGVGCVLRNNGNGTFGWYEDFPYYYGNLTSRETSAGDMDGDGDIDIISGIHHSKMEIFRNNGSGVFNVSTVPYDGETTCGATLPICADMDNDGDLDIVSQYMSAFGTCSPQRPITVDLWLNDGTGRVHWVSNTNGLTNGEEECNLLVADFDNDADLDIIQLTFQSRGIYGENRYYVNDGSGHFTEQASSRGLSGNTEFTDFWAKAAHGDFDNDGDIDIYYHGGLWTNNGSGSFAYSKLSGTVGRVQGAADLDGDGDLDLAGKRLYFNTDAGDGFWLFRNNTNNNNWLIVNVDDGPLNPYGVGAKVYVYDGNRLVGYRQVIAASAMQQPTEAHFGLGPTTTVRVEVIFPDGTFTVRDNVSHGQRITIVKNGTPVSPSTPSGLAASGTDFGCADLTWDTPPAAESVNRYVLAWGPSPGNYNDSTVVSLSDILRQGGTSSYQHCLGAAGDYCFTLRAHNAYDLWSAYSTAACATVTNDSTSLKPAAPAGFAALNSNVGCADLAWETPGAGESVDGYLLQWGPSSGSYTASIVIDAQDVSSQGGVSSYSHCLPDTGYYCFALRARNTYDLWSDNSNEYCIRVTSGLAQPPSPPTNVSVAEPDFGTARVSWSDVGDPSVAGYMAYYGDQSGAYADSADAGPDTSVDIPGLTDGMWYFAVRSYTGTGDRSAYSQEASLNLAGIDEVAPHVSSMTPANGATDVAINSMIFFTITDTKTGVDESSVIVRVNGTVVNDLEFYGDASEYSVVVTPGLLDANSIVDVQVSATDLASPPNPLSTSWNFETADETLSDADAPEFPSVQPANGATGVAADADVRVTVSDAVMGVDVSSIVFYVNDVSVGFSAEGGPYDVTLIYDKPGGFTPGSRVDVRVTACDLASPANCGELSAYSFTVASAAQSPPQEETAQVVPDGFWANDPTRPLEVRNLPISWTVRIFDTAGRRVREFTNNETDGMDWSWDFTNDSGSRVARAMYLVRVTGPDGTVERSGRFLVQTDS
jgi:hypothetical protein